MDTLAVFRAGTAYSVGEAWHKKLVDELSAASKEFREWWPRHDVRVDHNRLKEFNHPTAGRMIFQPITMRYEGDPPLRIVVKVPHSATEEKLMKLLAE